jgi:hypothetical protein
MGAVGVAPFPIPAHRTGCNACRFAELKTVAAGAEIAELEPAEKRVRRIEEAESG